MSPRSWKVLTAIAVFLAALTVIPALPPSTFDLNHEQFTPDPSHNPLDVIRGTPYEANHLDRFVGSRSEAETRAIMGEIDQEEATKNARASWFWTMVAFDMMIAAAAGLTFGGYVFYRRRSRIVELALNSVAEGVKVTRKTKHRVGGITAEIRRRADQE